MESPHWSHVNITQYLCSVETCSPRLCDVIWASVDTPAVHVAMTPRWLIAPVSSSFNISLHVGAARLWQLHLYKSSQTGSSWLIHVIPSCLGFMFWASRRSKSFKKPTLLKTCSLSMFVNVCKLKMLKWDHQGFQPHIFRPSQATGSCVPLWSAVVTLPRSTPKVMVLGEIGQRKRITISNDSQIVLGIPVKHQSIFNQYYVKKAW